MVLGKQDQVFSERFLAYVDIEVRGVVGHQPTLLPRARVGMSHRQLIAVKDDTASPSARRWRQDRVVIRRTALYSGRMLSRVRLVLMAFLTASAISLPACSSAAPHSPGSIRATSAIDHGTVLIAVAGTYDYALTSACQSFQFSNDGGKHDWLDSRGAVSLTAGTRSGSCYREALSTQSSVPFPCESPAMSNCVVVHEPTYPQKVSEAWSLTLTPVGSSY